MLFGGLSEILKTAVFLTSSFLLFWADCRNWLLIVLVRFQEWSPSRSVSSEGQFTPYRGGTRATMGGILERIQEGFATVSGRIQNWRKSLSLPSKTRRPSKESKNSKKKILDPQDSFLQTWNKVFLISTVLAVAVDPLFFYIPVLDREKTCLDLDAKLGVIACVLRSIIDIFYILHIVFRFRTGYIAPSSRVFGRGEIIDSPSAIAKRYLSTYFIVDILSIIPLPQVCDNIFLASWATILPMHLFSLLVMQLNGSCLNLFSWLFWLWNSGKDLFHCVPKTFWSLSYSSSMCQDYTGYIHCIRKSQLLLALLLKLHGLELFSISASICWPVMWVSYSLFLTLSLYHKAIMDSLNVSSIWCTR